MLKTAPWLALRYGNALAYLDKCDPCFRELAEAASLDTGAIRAWGSTLFELCRSDLELCTCVAWISSCGSGPAMPSKVMGHLGNLKPGGSQALTEIAFKIDTQVGARCPGNRADNISEYVIRMCLQAMKAIRPRY